MGWCRRAVLVVVLTATVLLPATTAHAAPAASTGTNTTLAQPRQTPDQWSRSRRFFVASVLAVILIWIVDGEPGRVRRGRGRRRLSLHDLPPPPAKPGPERVGRPPPLR
jgi:hypothetical protein